MDKLILITGGSSGIGKAVAHQLFDRGARIILQARGLEKLKRAALEIDPSGQKVSYYSTDLTDPIAVERSADQIIDQEGLPDVIINSAGSGEWLSFKEASLSHFSDTIHSPYLATALTCKVFYDRMQQRGSGHFVIVNSAGCYFSFPGATGYLPARWAMLGFARSLQADLYGSGFAVSMVALGKVDTPYFVNNPISEDRIPKAVDWLMAAMTEEEAGKVILGVVRSQKQVVIRPLMMRLLVPMNRLFPGLFRWLSRVTGYREA